jgi:hypothetical protein
VNPESLVERQWLFGYGHLDPLIGKAADAEVFPRISEFFLPGYRFGNPVVKASLLPGPRPQPRARRPLVGPVLGWTRREGDRWLARVWCRLDDIHVNPSRVTTMLYVGGQPVPGTFAVHLLKHPGAPVGAVKADDLGIEKLVAIDVPIEVDGADVEIAVASSYDDADNGGALPSRNSAQPTALGVAMDRRRDEWRERAQRGLAATRTVDRGYDERLDSVIVRRAVLEALADGQSSLAFAVASCRYAATIVDREAADFMFRRLRALLADGAPGSPALLLLVGDQIYADATAGTFDPKTRRERFYESYREAWTAPNARAVLRELPTYMMMDDHEVADDWAPAQTEITTRLWGVGAFRAYQWLHSPRNAPELLPRSSPERFDGRERHFYAFDAGGFPFFVCDTRGTRAVGKRIMEPAQLQALQGWLGRNREGDAHKFIVSPSLVVPFRKDAHRRGRPNPHAYLQRSDGWEAFPDSLRELMLTIAEQDIRNVVFLCGDAHISMTSRIEFERNGERVDRGTLCIVGSPLYAPFPFANSRAEEFTPADTLDLGGGWRMRYKVEGGMVEGDSFAVVHASTHPGPALRVAYHVRDQQEPIGPTLRGVARAATPA